MNAEALRRLAETHGSPLIVTVDCGISAVAEAQLARELGLELIVTDHHTIGPDLPAADVSVHPRLPGSTYPCGDLCGTGVAFKLAWQICKSFGDGKKASPHLRNLLVRSLGLVALATVADVVPLTGENRILVRHGLASIAAEPMEGMRALMKVAGCLGKSRLSTGTVGFSLAPGSMRPGGWSGPCGPWRCSPPKTLLLPKSSPPELDIVNTRRQELERAIVQEAQEMIKAQGGSRERGAIVVGKRAGTPA